MTARRCALRDRVVILDHGRVETARRYFDLGARDGLSRKRSIGLAMARDREKVLMNYGLFVVDMHAIVGHENSGRRSIAFRIDELVECIERRETIGTSLGAVLLRLKDRRVRALNLSGVLSGSLRWRLPA